LPKLAHIARPGWIVLSCLATSALAGTPQFGFPVACEIGRTCIVQNYVDHDPGPAARDYMCGSLTYDKHDGTDVRLPTIAAQRAGVDVLAAAGGEVRRVRDGMTDMVFRAGEASAIEGRECGNGVVVAHPDGWETQYCHLAKGSVRVRPGDRVVAGQPLGRVGFSGRASFPHLHFTVRQGGIAVDPFAFEPDAAKCGSGTSLWAPALRKALVYRERTVLNAGFAPAPVTMEQIDAAEVPAEALDVEAPALVAFVRAVGLREGDMQRLAVRAPDGKSIVDHAAEPLDRHKAQILLFVGKKRPASGWEPGTYTATYTVSRDGNVLLEQSFAAAIAASGR
jgi:murein DD-endopeptidase MepM/ murein hydrolase activator NlpD